MNKVEFGDWSIVDSCMREFADMMLALSKNNEPSVVITPNLQIFAECQKNSYLRSLIGKFDFAIPDGWPIALATSLKYRKRIRRIPGSDLLSYLIQRINVTGGYLTVIGNMPKNSRNDYYSVKLITPEYSSNYDELVTQIRFEIEQQKLRGILAICLGFPKQELIALELRKTFQGPILCLGAAWDFYTGNSKRAPRILRTIGLEWLWRLAIEPKRLWKRYLIISIKGLMQLLSKENWRK